MKKIKLENKRNILFVVMALAIITFVGSISYAYFTTAGRQDPVSGGFTTATMSLKFSDNDNGLDVKLSLGETATKKFTIENTGTVEASMSIDWVDLVNTYTNGSLTYRLTMSETEDGEYREVIPKTNIPVSSTPIKRMMDSEISVPAGEMYYYNLEVTFNNLDEDQSSDINAVFHSYFGAGQISRYRYYKLSVNPNGGVWDTYSSTQEYLLKNNETKTINNPTRVGYTFDGWDIIGNSSTLEGSTFSMGIEDASLVARWSVNSYNLTVDPNGGSYDGDLSKSVEYGSSVSVVDPSREGYTFTGWNVSGGTLSGTTYTMSEAKDATLTATWQINNYKYIAYHNKMNVNGVGYTRVEADTDEGEAEYNSTVTPEVKTYTGFDSPSQESITIKHETVYPPVLNKVEYNYDRHQHTLTIEPNDGTYTGQTTSTMYYEATVTLTPPTKTGYNFTKWTASTGTLDGNEFTMGDGDSTVTANYEAKTFSVTFNANGGETSTASKTVTYDSTYEELPTPTYEGYEFLGWFTTQEGGNQILSTTKVALSGNQTLFAHWKKSNPATTLLAKANDPSITDYNSGNKQEMYVFDHDELTTTTTDDNGKTYTHSATQVASWTSEQRRDYRYIGANPNNYITFNDETWRIIGVFTVENESGDKEQLIKIIRNESIEFLPWDSPGGDSYKNEWSTSTLQTLLNGDYYNTEEQFTYTYKDTRNANQEVTIPKGLNATARSQIAKVKWYLGAASYEYSLRGPDYYNFERGITTCVTTGKCSGETRTTNIIQNVGLMYPSDYVYTYGKGVNDTCYTDCGNCNFARDGWLFYSVEQWTMSSYVSYSTSAFGVNSYGGLGNGYNVPGDFGVRPTVYLDSKIAIVDGDGSLGNPYTLSMN